MLLIDHPLTAAKAANFVGLQRFRFFDHDAFLAYLRAECPQLTGVFHLGACSRTTENNREYLRRNNVEYSQAIWNWCAENHCPLLYASSAATYGNRSSDFDDRLSPESLQPMNPYGESKNDFDAWVLDQVRHGQPKPPSWFGTKFFNVYGPREGHKDGMMSVVWNAYRQISDTGEVRLFRSNDPAIADGEQRRDFVFVRDCIDHMLWLWRHAEDSGIYNSGTGIARTFLDLVRAVFMALEREPVIRFIDMPAKLKAQYQNFTQADMTKLYGIGYACAPTTLENGVLATVEWLRNREQPAHRRAA
jgi:ADP-L-glycero-D-manno-heptose 6-epimerase